MKQVIIVIVLVLISTITVTCGYRRPHHAHYGSKCWQTYGCHTAIFILKHDLGLQCTRREND